jgi:hypothetical protein
MAHSFEDSTSLETLIDHAVMVEAGLSVEDEGLEDLSVPWGALIVHLKGARDTRDEKRHAWLRAVARVRARDNRWDRGIVRVSGKAYFAANKDANAEPYAPLFGSIKARDALGLGPAKAVVFGVALADKLEKLNHPALVGEADAVRAANEGLQAAATIRTKAHEDVMWQSVERTRLVGQVNLLLAQTEAAILTRFPGDDERVKALLYPARKKEKAEDVELPTTPEG